MSLLLSPLAQASGYEGVPLAKAHINLRDTASLQRGAKIFMNYCAGCHSLKYMRYQQLASGLDIVDQNGQVAADIVKNNLIFTDAKILDPIVTAMPAKNAAQWFGIAPPDLSLAVRVRGVNWVYSYLNSFYTDAKRPWGSNNLIYPDVAMPNVLFNLQGEQIPVFKDRIENVNGKMQKIEDINHLILIKPGTMSPAQFDGTVDDVVNFLAFVSEPERNTRIDIGFGVMGFMLLLCLMTYLLKREYWKDITK